MISFIMHCIKWQSQNFKNILLRHLCHIEFVWLLRKTHKYRLIHSFHNVSRFNQQKIECKQLIVMFPISIKIFTPFPQILHESNSDLHFAPEGGKLCWTKSFRESINQHWISTNLSIVSTNPKEPLPQIWTNPYPVRLAILDNAHQHNRFKS